ncbi:Hrp-dependent type III effector protein [Methylobacterium sp. J-026]|uniref:four-carbon acid sugar kinase family protein n=1 Tax=Methylobacterium sp. J-026 TaxID=2836624 RepID=UPI001FB9462E|nr:four-carbon acid sugar kinase family protein [Methylobacterium sp. J-026]MCJ2137709.1 Hrp-dependent type III effector protein [Methylobacterium sp. J-026]
MPTLRLIADDLTGTLDTAAGLTGLCGTIPVAWPEILPDRASGSLAIDSGTRERGEQEAVRITRGLLPHLDGADIAFKKLDSLMRGPWATELAATVQAGGWRRCIVAPAFPYQGRATVEGRQQMRRGEDWVPVSTDIVRILSEAGLPARRAAVADGPVEGVAVYDARTDKDLAAIAALPADGSVLWCGSGGLAAALAGRTKPPGEGRLEGPVLGLFGSDRAETEAQLAACGPLRLVLTHGTPRRDLIIDRLSRDGAVMVSLDLSPGTARRAAAGQIAEAYARLIDELPRPGSLLVAGGETLKALCLALSVECLDVTGQIAPGLPRSTLRGGRWDGLPVVSKSGAFGASAIWRDLLSQNGFPHDRSGT